MSSLVDAVLRSDFDIPASSPGALPEPVLEEEAGAPEDVTLPAQKAHCIVKMG